MEAKIDIRKLQVLNDRICQTLDALNQIRASVHGNGPAVGGNVFGPGLSHTTAGMNPYGYSNFMGAGFAPQANFGFGAHPGYGAGFNQWNTPFGLSHTSAPYGHHNGPHYGAAPTTHFAPTGFAPQTGYGYHTAGMTHAANTFGPVPYSTPSFW